MDTLQELIERMGRIETRNPERDRLNEVVRFGQAVYEFERISRTPDVGAGAFHRQSVAAVLRLGVIDRASDKPGVPDLVDPELGQQEAQAAKVRRGSETLVVARDGDPLVNVQIPKLGK